MLALIGLTTLQQLTVLLPIGLYLGIVLALGRLYHESEMTAMAACGVGTASIYRPVALLTAVVVAVLAVLSYRVVPAAGLRAQQIRVEALRAAQFGALEPGRFRSFAGGDVVFYAERVRRERAARGRVRAATRRRTAWRSRSPSAPSSAAPASPSSSSCCTTAGATRGSRARSNGASSRSRSTGSRSACPT